MARQRLEPRNIGGTLLKHIHLADYITSASDRGAIGSISNSINYAPSHEPGQRLRNFPPAIREKTPLQIKQHSELLSNRRNYLQQKETDLLQAIPTEVKTDIKQLFWWLWRCLPQALVTYFKTNLCC
jgi:CRISPR-associated protein Cmr2